MISHPYTFVKLIAGSIEAQNQSTMLVATASLRVVRLDPHALVFAVVQKLAGGLLARIETGGASCAVRTGRLEILCVAWCV